MPFGRVHNVSAEVTRIHRSEHSSRRSDKKCENSSFSSSFYIKCSMLSRHKRNKFPSFFSLLYFFFFNGSLHLPLKKSFMYSLSYSSAHRSFTSRFRASVDISIILKMTRRISLSKFEQVLLSLH